MKIEDCISVIDNCSWFDDVSTSVGEAWDRIKTELMSKTNENLSFDLGSLPSTTYVHISGLRNTITDNLSGIPNNPTHVYIGYIPPADLKIKKDPLKKIDLVSTDKVG